MSVRLRLRVRHEVYWESVDSGYIHLVEDAWSERTITYRNRPGPGRQIGRLGRVTPNEVIERELNVDLTGRKELSLALVPTHTNGAGYCSRETDYPPMLIIEYELPR